MDILVAIAPRGDKIARAQFTKPCGLDLFQFLLDTSFRMVLFLIVDVSHNSDHVSFPK